MMHDPVALLVGVAVCVALLVGGLLGYVLGLREADGRWAEMGARPGSKKVGERVFLVCAADSPEACHALLEWLEYQRDQREIKDAVERVRKGLRS